jgi:hypothetical protein
VAGGIAGLEAACEAGWAAGASQGCPSSCQRLGLTVGSPATITLASGIGTGRAARWGDATPAASSTLEYTGTQVIKPVKSSTRNPRPAEQDWRPPLVRASRRDRARSGYATSAIRHPSNGEQKAPATLLHIHGDSPMCRYRGPEHRSDHTLSVCGQPWSRPDTLQFQVKVTKSPPSAGGRWRTRAGRRRHTGIDEQAPRRSPAPSAR